ncbi:hypothetical protein [Loktanella sp. SALINAS62]|uniref:hypothetical protein n=1 Tax=Loktanella sp. SALINAS62 TaxID=2706124 RepID=UPI001B8CCA9B|nr:hypothetical protein [Loktanella sp. SALINAS62]MBS1302760.1 hypothetical protein [Loktanella sp. SALINAS62]
MIKMRRPLKRRFENYQDGLRFHEPQEVYSVDELDKLSRFAARLGLDFGEVDALRDWDGRHYVVDVNNRPTGPAKELREDRKRRAFDRRATRFAVLVDDIRAAAA